MLDPTERALEIAITVSLNGYHPYSLLGLFFYDTSNFLKLQGIVPTFGPCWVNFYGSPMNYSFIGKHEELDEGLGEGAAYKGRLLCAIRTEIKDGESGGPSKAVRTKLRSTAKVRTMLTFYVITLWAQNEFDNLLTYLNSSSRLVALLKRSPSHAY